MSISRRPGQAMAIFHTPPNTPGPSKGKKKKKSSSLITIRPEAVHENAYFLACVAQQDQACLFIFVSLMCTAKSLSHGVQS